MFDRPLVAKLHLKLPRGRNLRAIRVHIQVVSAYQGPGKPRAMWEERRAKTMAFLLVSLFTNPKTW